MNKSDKYCIFKSLPSSVLSLFYTTFYVNGIYISNNVPVLNKERIDELNKMLISARPVLRTIDSNYSAYMETEGVVGLESFSVEYESRYLILPVATVDMKVVIPINFLFNITRYFYFISIGLIWDVSYGCSYNENELLTLLSEMYPHSYKYNDVFGNIKEIKVDDLIGVISNVIATKRIKFIVYSFDFSISNNNTVSIYLKGFKLNNYLFSTLNYPIIPKDIINIQNKIDAAKEQIDKKVSDLLAGRFGAIDYSNVTAFINLIKDNSNDSYVKKRYSLVVPELSKQITEVADSAFNVKNKKFSNYLIYISAITDYTVNGNSKIKVITVHKYSLLGILNEFIINAQNVDDNDKWAIDLSNIDYEKRPLLQFYLGGCLLSTENVSGYEDRFRELMSCVKKCLDKSKKLKGNYSVKNFVADYLNNILEIIKKYYDDKKLSDRILPYLFIKEKDIIVGGEKKSYNVFEFILFDSKMSPNDDIFGMAYETAVKSTSEGGAKAEIMSIDSVIREKMHEHIGKNDDVFVDLLFDTKSVIIEDGISMSVNADPNLRNILAEKATKAVKAGISVSSEINIDYSKSKVKNDEKDYEKRSLLSFLPMEASLKFAFYNKFEVGETVGIYYGPIMLYWWTVIGMSENITNSSNFLETTIKLVRK